MGGFVRFFNCSIPVTGCNLRCSYCYIAQHGDEKLLDVTETKEGFCYSVEYMVKALTTQRMGGVCAFQLCGVGETLLWADIVEFTEGLLRNGHYVSFTSNCLIDKPLRRFAQFPKAYRDKLFFKCSFHFRELKKRSLLNKFAENVNLLKQAGISFTVEVVTNDETLNELDEVKAFSLERFGALPHVLTQRDETRPGQYPRKSTRLAPQAFADTWGAFDSPLFAFQQAVYDLPHPEYCYAGEYCLELDLRNGAVHPCPGNNRNLTNLFEDIQSLPIFAPVGRNCPFGNCLCGFFMHVLAGVSREYDPGYFFYQFRDRLCSDGSRWLTPEMREAYSHRCSEYHAPYSEERAFFVDMLMRQAYRNDALEETLCAKLASILEDSLRKKGIQRLAVYGAGKLGRWLISLLKGTSIAVGYAIDRRWPELPEAEGIAVQSPNEPIAGVDAIIVSVYSEFTAIAPLLRQKTSCPALSIVELVD